MNLWLKGLIAAVVSGVSTALLVSVGDISTGVALDYRKLAGVAAAGALIGLAGYLKQSPIPPTDPPGTLK